MKKALILMLLVAVVLSSAFASGAAEAAAPAKNEIPSQIAIATASAGGAYYPVGVGLSEILKKTFPNMSVSVEVTGGTVENPGLVNLGDCEIGIANSDMAYFALVGEKPFEAEHPNLKGWINGMAPGVVHYAVLNSSGINTLADLKGKRIAVGPQGNSTSLFLAKVLGVLGIAWEEITPSYLSFADGIQALVDGKVDMAIVSAGPPVSSIIELAASGKAWHLIDFDAEFTAKFLEAYPYYISYTIPANTYNGQTADVHTTATTNMLMVNANLSEEFVYQMTKAAFENLSDWAAAANSVKTITLKDAPNTSIPLHEGAARYYREVGVL